MDLKKLSDEALIESLKSLRAVERESIAEVVAHLAEMDRRDLAVESAFPSLFVYCVKELGYSEAAAYHRIRAARAARQHPRIIELLRSGQLQLEAVVLLNPHLERPDAAALIDQPRGQSKREVQRIVARIAPKPDRPDSVRVLSIGLRPPFDDTLDLFGATQSERAVERVHFSFTGDRELSELLERAQELMRHKYPEGRIEDIVKDALNALLERKDPNRWVRIPKPAH